MAKGVKYQRKYKYINDRLSKAEPKQIYNTPVIKGSSQMDQTIQLPNDEETVDN